MELISILEMIAYFLFIFVCGFLIGYFLGIKQGWNNRIEYEEDNDMNNKD